ncbi:YutD family protein [Enterococcus camelliae]|uniref:YutD family protein n=1 Tax=Enterococcus camelliae TaxID=453959 RepID=A0ABW5TIC1_9ENTE
MTKEDNLTDELTAVLEEIVEETSQDSSKSKGLSFEQINETEFFIDGRQYRLVKEHRAGFDAEKLVERYSEVLARYDYIVGDWGYEQLRLKGFFDVENKRVLPDQRIDTLEDYLYEFCNFGCAYFVLERIGGKKEKAQTKKNKKRSSNTKRVRGQAHVSEKKETIAPHSEKKKMTIRQTKQTKNNPQQPTKQQANRSSKKEFTIRQRNEGE